jgi:hypothetical protein
MYQVSWIDKEGKLNFVSTPSEYNAEAIGCALWLTGMKVRTWYYATKGCPKLA